MLLAFVGFQLEILFNNKSCGITLTNLIRFELKGLTTTTQSFNHFHITLQLTLLLTQRKGSLQSDTGFLSSIITVRVMYSFISSLLSLIWKYTLNTKSGSSSCSYLSKATCKKTESERGGLDRLSDAQVKEENMRRVKWEKDPCGMCIVLVYALLRWRGREICTLGEEWEKKRFPFYEQSPYLHIAWLVLMSYPECDLI